jgi:Flp pilus assembly protein TadG
MTMIRRAAIKRGNARRRQRGSNLVEMALTISVFLMLLFGIIEFGRGVFAYNQLSYLAHEGARFASLNGSTVTNPATGTTISDYVNSKAIAIGTVVTTTEWQNGSNLPGHWVRVRVAYPFTFVAPYMPASSLTLASTAQDSVLQ